MRVLTVNARKGKRKHWIFVKLETKRQNSISRLLTGKGLYPRVLYPALCLSKVMKDTGK